MSNDTIGENGEVAFISTNNKCLDLFAQINREVPNEKLARLFVDAWNEDQNLCSKILLNFRDIRSGKGEKSISRRMMILLKLLSFDTYMEILPFFIDVGCWKDICILGSTMPYACIPELNLIKNQLITDQSSKNPSLCAKWAPSETGKFNKYPLCFAQRLAIMMNISPKEYRKMLTRLRSKINLIETNLSQNKLDGIVFDQIPSKAHLLYKDTLKRDHNSKKVTSDSRKDLSARYLEFLNKVKTGGANVNYKGIMPHEIIEKYGKIKDVTDEVLENQWQSIRKELEDTGIFQDCISIVDVSGSMHGTPMSVAIALGILVSECSLSNLFSNKVVTFHSEPKMVDLSKFENLKQKIDVVSGMEWGANTNLEKTFDLLINLNPKQLPKTLFIFTDMQFDMVEGFNSTPTFDKLKTKCENAGLIMPTIICWNLRSVSSVPFTIDADGVCLMSGFSSELMKSFITGQKITPMNILLNACDGYKIPNYRSKIVLSVPNNFDFETIKCA